MAGMMGPGAWLVSDRGQASSFGTPAPKAEVEGARLRRTVLTSAGPTVHSALDGGGRTGLAAVDWVWGGSSE